MPVLTPDPTVRKRYIGEFSNDAAALNFIQSNLWDTAADGSGDPHTGHSYYDTTLGVMKTYKGGNGWVEEYAVDNHPFRRPVITVYLVGHATVATINALTPTSGDAYVATDGGTLNPGALLVVAGEIAEFNGAAWVKLSGGFGGSVAAGIRVALSTQTALVAPFTEGVDDGKIVTYTGSGFDYVFEPGVKRGDAVLVTPASGYTAYYTGNIYYLSANVPSGLWTLQSGPETSEDVFAEESDVVQHPTPVTAVRTTLKTFTIGANKLAEDGDLYKFDIYGSFNAIGRTHKLVFVLNGTDVFTLSLSQGSTWKLWAEVIRSAATGSIVGVTLVGSDGNLVPTTIYTSGALSTAVATNWSTPIAVKIDVIPDLLGAGAGDVHVDYFRAQRVRAES